MKIVTERRIGYEYGPDGMKTPFIGSAVGAYTWDELIERIEDDRWGSSYRITSREERQIVYGDWEKVQ